KNSRSIFLSGPGTSIDPGFNLHPGILAAHRLRVLHGYALPFRHVYRLLHLPRRLLPRMRYPLRAVRPHSPNPRFQRWTNLADLPILRLSASWATRLKTPAHPVLGFSLAFACFSRARSSPWSLSSSFSFLRQLCAERMPSLLISLRFSSSASASLSTSLSCRKLFSNWSVSSFLS